MCIDAVEGGLTLVMKTIQAAALSEAEQQTLVDTLLSKPGHQWTKVAGVEHANVMKNSLRMVDVVPDYSDICMHVY